MWIAKNTTRWVQIGGGIFVVSILMVVTLGLPLGIHFAGGALTEVSYPSAVEKTTVDDALINLDLGNYSLRETVTESGGPGYVLRSRDLSEPERLAVRDALLSVSDGAAIERFTSIGPVIGEELKSKAVWAIMGVALIIILYVAYAFSGVSYPVGSWTYGGITIVALLHDVLVPTAVFSVLAYFTGAEVDVLFVMALLAVLGYSVNDTIVVFDRVRENLLQFRKETKRKVTMEAGIQKDEVTYELTKPFNEIVGMSVTQTLTRSINTSATTLLALTALYLLGGEVTQNFALMLVAGVIAGTYSSIFIANPLLIWFGERALKKEKNS